MKTDQNMSQNTDTKFESIVKKVAASPAQQRYATTLFYGAITGFILMLVTYFLYVTGIITPQIPLDQLPHLWTHNAASYRAAGSIPQGWGWLHLITKGDIANFIGIVFLAGVTLICYVQLAWSFIKTREWIMVVIAILEVLVLVSAASGLLV